MEKEKIIAWFSGGVTSAVCCKICLDLYGHENVRIVFIDTKNEHEDTYRFLNDCEKWYGKKIETITGVGKLSLLNDRYESIEDIWAKYKSLNVAHGAICSSQLKRRVREVWQKTNKYKAQAFGFDINEPKRAKGMALNNKHLNPIFPLLLYGLSKKDCIKMLNDANIEAPLMYKMGFLNNNCFRTGCVQGGIGYWQKIRDEFPDTFDRMANMEHKLTNIKGKPVTMLRSQKKDSYKKHIFLKPHPEYKDCLDLSLVKGRPVKPLFECNGFCGINDLMGRSATEEEINYED